MFGWKRKEPDPHEEMVKNQLMARGITDTHVLEAFRSLPREEFIPSDYRKQAYEDKPLPIGSGQTISQPYMTALMSQALQVAPGSKVLEIGTGSGYQTAVLAKLGGDVFTIETIPDLSREAQRTLESLGLRNIHYYVRDGSLGLESKAPFDRILVTAAAPGVPTPLLEQMSEGGILVVPTGDRNSQQLTRVKKVHGSFESETICPCVFVPLVGAAGFPD